MPKQISISHFFFFAHFILTSFAVGGCLCLIDYSDWRAHHHHQRSQSSLLSNINCFDPCVCMCQCECMFQCYCHKFGSYRYYYPIWEYTNTIKLSTENTFFRFTLINSKQYSSRRAFFRYIQRINNIESSAALSLMVITSIAILTSLIRSPRVFLYARDHLSRLLPTKRK